MSNEVSQQETVPLTVEQALQQAIAHHQTGQLQDAERLYRAILLSQPKHPDANHNLGVLSVQVKQPAVALPLFKAALDANPNQGQYWLSYIDALILSGQISAARHVLEEGRQRGLQGVAIAALTERLEYEVRILGKSTATDPHTPNEAPPSTSLIPQNTKAKTRRTKLTKSARRPVPSRGKAPDAREVSALVALFDKGLFTEAANHAQTLTVRFPLHGMGWKALGVALNGMGRVDDALIPMQNAVALLPTDPEAHSNLGNALKDLGQLGAAVASHRQALIIKPDYAEAHNNLGIALQRLGQLDDAVTSYRQALKIKPDYAEAHNDLGVALQGLGQLDDAVTSYRQVLKINANFAEAHSYLGLVLLLMGNFEEGWRNYESRFDPRMKKRSSIPPITTIPQWRGESLAAKSLLIWHEQGLGDQIQFCRYLAILRGYGTRRITLVCGASLKSLFQRLDDADDVLTIAEAENVPSHDYWTFPLSIPLYCNTKPENTSTVIPYLYANEKLQQEIATQVANIAEFKVGLNWQGSKTYAKDAERSPGLEPFKTLFNVANARFFTLQPGSRAEFLSAAGSAAFDLGHEIDSLTPPFEETAALMMNLDLVITSDTSIAHLAGALGRPAWVVLPFVPDWRWLMDREDSPWYPNTRLFRQSSRGDWGELFERVAQRLKSVIAGESKVVWPIVKPQ